MALVRALQHAAPMGHVVFDPQGRYLRVNDAALKMSGTTRQERLGRPVTEVHPDVGRAVADAVDRVARFRRPLHRQRLAGELSRRPGERRVWLMTYYPIVLDDGNVLGVGVIVEDVTDRERSSRHLRVVGAVTSALLRTGSADEVAAVIAAGVATQLGARGGVVVDGDGGGRRLGVLDHAGRLTWTGAPALAVLAPDGEVSGAVRELAPGSPEAAVLAAAVRGPAGVPVSVLWLTVPPAPAVALVLASEGRSQPDPTDRSLYAAVADQCAVALERAWSAQHAAAAAALTARLQHATAGLAQALSEEEIAAVVLAEARTGLGATGGGFGLVDQPRRVHRFISMFGWDQLQLGDLLGDRSIDDPSLSAATMRRGEPTYVESPGDLARYMPADRASRLATAVECGACACLPVMGVRGPIGTFTLMFRAPRRFLDQEKAFLGSLAGQAAVAVDRVRRHRAEHQIAVVLQRALLPQRVPAVHGLAVAVRYLAGAEQTHVGGDWYDVFTLEDGAVALVIGDVAGHDLEAAGTMGQLRAQVRAYASGAEEPGDTLSRLDRLVRRDGAELERFATLIYARWLPGSTRLDLAVAGHLPPVRVDTGGASFVPCQVGPPVGAAIEPARYATGRIGLPEGGTTTLVLYTDGLVERPRCDLRDSLELLREAAEAGQRPDPNDLADHLVAAMRPETGWEDDVALLVCRLAT